MAEKTEGQRLMEELGYSFKNIGKEEPSAKEAAFAYCEGYIEFLNRAKTEREFVREAEAKILEAGYTEIDRTKNYVCGDKIYRNNRGKSMIMTTIGKRPLCEGVRFNIAHIDSPRLDLKPNPLYEKDDLAYFKTHYYGGIRKYQWGVTPLAMHGRVIRKDGSVVDFNLGENSGDPVFVISDLLPHLAAKQNDRPLREGLRGEELNIILGSFPFEDSEVKEAVKLNVLKLLNDAYGITEGDFMRAEVEFVPAAKVTDVGIDRSLIGGYGQDDKVCGYPALCAEIEATQPEYTTVTVLVDKEEIGSVGNSGMSSDMLLHYLEDLAETQNVRVRDILRNSLCLSSDVNAAYDPTFPDVFEANNASYLNRGPVLTKYTGARGKSGSNDASAETMAKFIKIMDDHNVFWQIGELGKVDEGGGGTIAQFMGNMDVDTVDLGVPVLAMHSPFEITSKLDVYYTYKAFSAFYA